MSTKKIRPYCWHSNGRKMLNILQCHFNMTERICQVSKVIQIEISDENYEELFERANEVKRAGIEAHGNQFTMSEHDVICNAAKLGIVLHIESSMDIFERNFQKTKRGAQHE